MTAPLYAIDGEADQKSYEEYQRAEQERRDFLIQKAVSSFAPELAGTTDVRVIHLYSTNASLRKELREMFRNYPRFILVEHCGDGRPTRKGVNEVQYHDARLPLPATADLVATKAALNTSVEWLAARLKALPVVLPEASEWLSAALDRKGVLVIVGAEQAK